jgi:hypothetical protein
MTGLPATPSPFVTVTPVDEPVSVLPTTVLPLVLEIIPLTDVSRLPEAPFRMIEIEPRAPVSVRPTPVPPCKLREFGSVDSVLTVMNVCCCVGELAIAATVVWTVCPFWLIGTDSVPVSDWAAGSCEIVTCAIMVPC